MTGWFRGLVQVCHADLNAPWSGRWPGVRRARQPRRGIGARVASKSSSSLPARTGDRQPGGEEKNCAAISQRLQHQVKVAVGAAKQDARSVHFRLDRRGPGGILKSAGRAQSMKFTAHSRRALQREGNGSWRTQFAAMTGLVTTMDGPVPGRAAGPGIRRGDPARCGSR